VAPPELAVSLARTRIGDRYRSLAARAGAPVPEPALLEEALAPFSPARRAPNVRRALIAAGRHDIIVPLEAPLALARAWGVEARVYPRGHLTLLLACRQLRRDVARFLAD
jgi:predicted alpha/beta hydrolase family esterase